MTNIKRFLSVPYNDIGAYSLLLLAVWLLYSNVVGLWWTYDDTQILKHAILYSPYQYFLNPHIWQEFSPNFLTPLLSLSFDIDFQIFGLNPMWFYVHHLTMFWLCSVLIYVVLKRWVKGTFALLGSLLFLIGSPVAVMSQQLMTHHYVEGLFFALIAIHLFVQSLERRTMKWSYFSACAYAISIVAKEVYVPLVFLLLVLPYRDGKSRLKHIVPHFFAALLYFIWRWWMLWTPLGGYGERIDGRNVLLLPYNIVNLLFDVKHKENILILSAAVFIIIILFLSKRWRSGHIGIWIFIVAMLPIIPVSHTLTYRYVFVPWVAVTFLLVSLMRVSWNSKIIGKILCTCLLIVVMLLVASQSRKTWSDNLKMARRMNIEGKFIFEEADSHNLLRKPSFEGHYFEGIHWLKNNYYGRTGNPVWFYDDIYLCENNLKGKRVWEYMSEEQKLKDITDLIPDITRAYCARVRTNAPLTIKSNYSKNIISWELGPYKDGKYSYIIGGLETKKDIPPKGSLRVHFKNYVQLRIRYESPESWMTFSPYLKLNIIDDSGMIKWRRD